MIITGCMKPYILLLTCVFLVSCTEEGSHRINQQNNKAVTDYNTDTNNTDTNNTDTNNTDTNNTDTNNTDTNNTDTNNTDTDNTDTNNTDTNNTDTNNTDTNNTDTNNTDTNNTDTNNTDKNEPEIPFEYELTSFPAGEIVNHDGEIVQIKAFKLFTQQASTSFVWDCIMSGNCQKSIYRPLTDGCYALNAEGQGLPANCISYDGAVQFCNWLGGRLPTEEEWEYAARFDGEKLRDVDYAWGNEPPELCVNANFRESEDTMRTCACYHVNSFYPQILESIYFYEYLARPCLNHALEAGMTPTGLTHMSGSLADYVDYAYEEHDDITYMVKGGSFLSLPEQLKITSREYIDLQDFYSTTTYAGIGVRCAFDDE